MKWFYNLKRVARVVIAVCSWLPLFIFTGIIGDSVGENGENMQTWQALIICVLLAVGVVFTVFAIKARRKETQADRDAKRAERVKLAEEKKKESKQYIPADAPVLTMSDATIRAGIVNSDEGIFEGTPAYVVKLVKNGSEDMQYNIENSNVGDDITLDFDIDKCLYVCLGNYGEIGFLPESVGEKLSGKFCVKITDIKENDEGRYSVEVSIYLPAASSVSFPIYTKAVGVTFDNCQKHIQESRNGDKLIIKHAPSGEYPDSVDIINERISERIGRIKSDLAKELLNACGRGFVLTAEIADITGGGEGQNYGCNIKIIGEHFDE